LAKRRSVTGRHDATVGRPRSVKIVTLERGGWTSQFAACGGGSREERHAE
jgi:hypothetical protein